MQSCHKYKDYKIKQKSPQITHTYIDLITKNDNTEVMVFSINSGCIQIFVHKEVKLDFYFKPYAKIYSSLITELNRRGQEIKPEEKNREKTIERIYL